MTIAIISLTLGYFIIKLQELMAGSDQTINYNIMHGYYDEREGLNLFESNHKMAVAVVDAGNRKTKYDPRYVRMTARHF